MVLRWKQMWKPAENLMMVPVVELAGDQRLLVENHKGVTQYLNDCIGIRMQYGTLEVRGNALQLRQMTSQQLIIHGCIDRISLIRSAGNEL